MKTKGKMSVSVCFHSGVGKNVNKDIWIVSNSVKYYEHSKTGQNNIAQGLG